MHYVKANICFILKIATELLEKGDNLNAKYYKEIFRAFKRFNESGNHYYYKVYLTDTDLERFDLKYLFFKNELKELETTFEVLRIGDLFKEHKIYHDYKQARTFDNIILFKRFLDTDKLYNVIYVNKRQLKFLKDLENRNHLKWYNVKDNEEEYEIVKRGNFTVRNQYIRKLYIESEEDIYNITLKDVLSIIPIKYMSYGIYGTGNGYNKVEIKSKIDMIITELERRTFFFNNHISIKMIFIRHLREILYPLFQSNEEDQTYLEDYL